jgi:23S rRNA U2552 (ribose-2'-O)-methylase RlmE/FtsJ
MPEANNTGNIEPDSVIHPLQITQSMGQIKQMQVVNLRLNQNLVLKIFQGKKINYLILHLINKFNFN